MSGSQRLLTGLPVRGRMSRMSKGLLGTVTCATAEWPNHQFSYWYWRIDDVDAPANHTKLRLPDEAYDVIVFVVSGKEGITDEMSM